MNTADLNGHGRFTINRFGHVIDADQSCAALFGMRRVDLLRTKIFRFIQRQSKKQFFRQCLKTIESGEPQECQLNLIYRGGATLQTDLKSDLKIDREGYCIIDWHLTVGNE